METMEATKAGDIREELLLHLDAAYNLAKWLTRDGQDAEDVVQESYLRAFRYIRSFRGDNVRSWLLTIVRNTCFSWLQGNRRPQDWLEFDENVASSSRKELNPEEMCLQGQNAGLLRSAMERLPANFREVIVLRELEGMSYREISQIVGIPPGTVMSRLSRARGELRQSLMAMAI